MLGIVALALGLTGPADAGALRRYNFRVVDSSADPTARVPQFYVADAESDCPSSGDLADADVCYALAEDTLRVRAAGAWVALGGASSVTLSGDVDGPSGATVLDAAAVEGPLEAVLDLQDQQGAVTDGQVPNNITVDLATAATSAAGLACTDCVTLTTETVGSYAAGDAEAGNATGLACTDCAALGTETTGDYVASFSAGAGLSGAASGEGSAPTLATASGETDFLASGALTCGAATQGRAQVHTTPLQYCDNAATPTLRYAAYGDSAGAATAVAANSVALTTGTTGNYALGDAEGGAATTGDTATAFFGAGQIEAARGGTGIDTSASVGFPALASAGTWSVGVGRSPATILCPSGNEAAGLCKTFTNLNLSGAGYVGTGTTVVALIDLSPPVTKIRLYAALSAPAVTGDIVLQCDTSSTFASPTDCATLDNPGSGNSASAWQTLSGADCVSADAWCRVGMQNGNTTEDPAVKVIGYALQ